MKIRVIWIWFLVRFNGSISLKSASLGIEKSKFKAQFLSNWTETFFSAKLIWWALTIFFKSISQKKFSVEDFEKKIFRNFLLRRSFTIQIWIVKHFLTVFPTKKCDLEKIWSDFLVRFSKLWSDFWKIWSDFFEFWQNITKWYFSLLTQYIH